MDKPLLFYSGTYQQTITTKQPNCIGFSCKTSVTVNSFWRVIIDDADRTTILITQQPKKSCSEDTFICDEDRAVLEDYRVGGCTYTCSLNYKTMDLLRLPILRIERKLEIQYPRNVEPESEITPQSAGEESHTDAQSLSTIVDISNFAEGATFAAAVLAVDAATAAMMQTEGAFDSGNGSGNADGANDGTDGVGHNNDGYSGGQAEGGPGGEGA